jgi:hypothetical protein
LLGYFSAEVGRETEISNHNGVRGVNFATSEIIIVKRTMFPHSNVYKYTWTSDGNLHVQIDDVLIDRRGHSEIFDVRSCKGADCDTVTWT